jgi:hypothetical protein
LRGPCDDDGGGGDGGDGGEEEEEEEEEEEDGGGERVWQRISVPAEIKEKARKRRTRTFRGARTYKRVNIVAGGKKPGDDECPPSSLHAS